MTLPADTARHAFYFAPEPDHPLWAAGCAWLGRDPEQPARHVPPAAGPQQAFLRAPRRYGFHATLKAPMRLRDAGERAALLDAAARLARATPAFAMPALDIGLHRGFLALLPRERLTRRHPLRRFADAVVIGLDAFRAPPSPDEHERQRAAPLTARARARLERWGYPQVLGAWRFHLTLTDPLPPDPALRTVLHREAAAHFAAALAAPLECRSLCLFEEPAPGAPFVLTARLPLGA